MNAHAAHTHERARTLLCIAWQLCNEDHQWWWRSFFNAGAAGFYLLGYSCIYFYTQLEMVSREAGKEAGEGGWTLLMHGRHL